MAYNSLDSQTAQTIIKELNEWLIEHSFLYADHARWYIGITDNPDRRYDEHLRKSIANKFSVKHFICWDAKTFNIARAVESHGHSLGMLDSDLLGNATRNSIYVYVYKKFPTLKAKR